MLSNTGNLSFWLSIFFIVISSCGILFIYLIIKNKSLENENIDKIIELGKWFIVSVAITLSASIVNDGFKEREQDIKEMEVFDKYVKTVLEARGIEKVKLLCEYFSAVSPDGPIKASWKEYENIVDKHITEIREAENKVADINERARNATLSPSEINEKDRLEEKISAALNQRLLPKSDEDTPEWAIIAGGDFTPEDAKDEVKKIETLNYPVGIYKKGNSYRTVAGPFLDQASTIVALTKIKKEVRSSSYSVNLKIWCKTPETKNGYIECKQ